MSRSGAPHKPRPVPQQKSPTLTSRTSVVVAVGPDDTGELAGLQWAHEVSVAYPDVEIVVVEEREPGRPRPALRPSVPRARVVHRIYPFGSAAAYATAVNASDDDYVVIVSPHAAAEPSVLGALLSPFATDPGIGWVTVENELGGASGIVALRRSALGSLGGVRALLARPSNTVELGPLPHGLFVDLARAGWRSAQVRGNHQVGPFGHWERHRDTDGNPLARLSWPPVPVPECPRPGINVVGLLEAACGIGDAARRYSEAIRVSRVPHATFAYQGHSSPTVSFEHRGRREFSHDTNLLVLNPETLQLFAAFAGSELWRGRYTIGIWFWELEALADRHREALRLVNELWVSSGFLEKAFSAATDKPVRHIPLPVRRREGRPTRDKAELGLPEAFTFLTTFDFGSLAVRKNGLGVIEAFCRAFTENEGPVLVLKTLNAAYDPGALAEIEHLAGKRRDVVLLDGYVGDDTISEMIGRSDCFVSLHRSEGFGLTPAEAMAWGRPVIATGYSGNLDFMTEQNSLLIPYRMVGLPDSLRYVYPSDATWAEPDLDAAARAMRAVYDDQVAATARALLGQRDIRRSNSIDAAAKAISGRFREISALRTAAARRAA